MSIAEEVKKKIQAERPTGCKVDQLIQTMDTEDVSAIVDAFALAERERFRIRTVPVPIKPYYTIAWLVSLFNDNGYPVGKTAVSDHLQRKCSCDRSE